MNTLNYLRGRRIWYVPNYSVWGLVSSVTVNIVTSESINGQSRLSFSEATIGAAEQTVTFTDLVDHRGNSVPASISEPKVVIVPRSENSAYLIGREYAQGFKIARESAAADPVTVDLVIYELG